MTTLKLLSTGLIAAAVLGDLSWLANTTASHDSRQWRPIRSHRARPFINREAASAFPRLASALSRRHRGLATTYLASPAQAASDRGVLFVEPSAPVGGFVSNDGGGLRCSARLLLWTAVARSSISVPNRASVS